MALPARFDREAAVEAWEACGISEGDAELLWEAFESAGVFAPDEDGSWWDELGWREARAYHASTRDYPFIQMDEPGAFASDARRMVAYGDEEAAPSPYQRLGGEPVALPRARNGESPDDWLERLTEAERKGLDGLGLLLDVCFGERGQMTIADGSRCLLKSIPSGGARHPTEVFLAAFDVDALKPGVYHYDVNAHRLELVRAGDLRDRFEEATLDLFTRQRTPPSAAFVFTSRVERAMWRYRDPRSFRAILVDVGHAVAAYRHVARTLGYRTLAYQKMRDTDVARLVGVDPALQPPLCVGTLVP